jgi:hypothetical protein
MKHLLRPRIWPSFSPSCRLYEPEAGRPRVSGPATYRSGTETNPAVPRDGGQVAPIFVVSRQRFMKYPGLELFHRVSH